MIALVASVVLALYVIIPGLLSRFIYRLFVPLRAAASSKTEEATRAVVTAIFPFLLALIVVWYIPGLNSFPVKASRPELAVGDYRLVSSCLYSEQIFSTNAPEFWEALRRTFDRQVLFLSWYYLLTVLTALGLGYLAGAYGTFRTNSSYRWFADKVLFPRISEWHPLLTAFVFADKLTVVRADVLTTTDTLYRGKVSEYFVDAAGKLTGLILTEAKRFDRRTYLRDWEEQHQRNTEEYWREIPGAKMYMFADKIVNLNLHYESAEPPEDVLAKFIRDRLNRNVRIKFTSKRRKRS